MQLWDTVDYLALLKESSSNKMLKSVQQLWYTVERYGSPAQAN